MAKSELSKMDQEFVSKAAQDGLAEIEMAKLAGKKAQSSKLRELANAMEKDHSEAKNKLGKLASKMGVDLPTKVDSEHSKLMEEVSGYEGEEFDRHFISTVISEHEKNIKLFHSESEHGRDEELKSYAAEIAPTLEKHLDQARSLGA